MENGHVTNGKRLSCDIRRFHNVNKIHFYQNTGNGSKNGNAESNIVNNLTDTDEDMGK